MNALPHPPALTLAIAAATVATAALAADYEGAESRKGATRGEACNRAKSSASIAARAAGRALNTISTGACDCQQIDKSGPLAWECTVSWEAVAKNGKY